jgi:subtilisin family serine protease
MKAPRFFSLAVALILLAAVFTGCTDSPFEASESPIVQQETSKMRQSHLFANKFLSRGKVLERYAELAASNDFVLGMTKVLERYRVLERYDGYDGVSVKKNYEKTIDGFAARVDGSGMTVEEFLAIVEADPDIEWVEPDIKLLPNLGNGAKESGLPNQTLPSALKHIGADLGWTLAGDGQGSVDGVEVYVLDTGLAHDELNVVETVNFADDEMVPGYVWEHGTHVAGTIAAIDDGDGLVGVAPGARIHSLRVLNNQGEAELSSAIAAVEYVTAAKEASPSTPMVVNISLGADIGTWD